MSNKQARQKWARLTQASGMEDEHRQFVTYCLIRYALISSAGPEGLRQALDWIRDRPKAFGEKALKFVEDTVVPSNMQTDDSHFSLLSFPLTFSYDALWLDIICLGKLTVDTLLKKPGLIQLDLDDEMRACVKAHFND